LRSGYICESIRAGLGINDILERTGLTAGSLRPYLEQARDLGMDQMCTDIRIWENLLGRPPKHLIPEQGAEF
jgi:hypothetical protein